MGLFNVLKKLSNEIQKKNRQNPNVETADGSVFDNIRNAIEDIKNKRGDEPAPQKRTEAVEELRERVFEVQQKNKENPNIPTADSSVFDEFNGMLEESKNENYNPFSNDESESFNKEAEYEEVTPAPAPSSSSSDRVLAITNSMGGSLALRAEPDFGAATNQIRIPDMSRVYVVQYSQHSINLDGKDSRWVLVDFEGQRGWMLEGYLNFN